MDKEEYVTIRIPKVYRKSIDIVRRYIMKKGYTETIDRLPPEIRKIILSKKNKEIGEPTIEGVLGAGIELLTKIMEESK